MYGNADSFSYLQILYEKNDCVQKCTEEKNIITDTALNVWLPNVLLSS